MSDYTLELRKQVGHRPLLQVGASVIVEDAQGRVLLQRRTDNHCWGYLGGGVELDEQVEDAARREMEEESGLVAGEMTLYGVFSGKEYHYVYPNGDEVSNVDCVFHCKDFSGELRPQEDESEELCFFALSEIPENLSPPIAIPLRKWVSEKLRRQQD